MKKDLKSQQYDMTAPCEMNLIWGNGQWSMNQSSISESESIHKIINELRERINRIESMLKIYE